MDRERLPRVLVACRRALVVQALEVEVLHVSTDVGGAPRVMGGRAEDDAGCERCRDASRLVPGRAQVELDPGTRLLDEQVGIVREQRQARRGPGPGDRPLVGPLAARRAGELAEQLTREAAGRRRGGMARERREEAAGRLVAELGSEMGAQELQVPVPRERPREHRPAGGPRGIVVGEMGLRVEEHVLHRRRGHRPDPCGGALAETGDHRSGSCVPPCGDHRARPVDPHRAREAVVVQGELAEELREASVRLLQGEVHLEEAFACGDETLREPQVVEGAR